jgi:hypothetical protein
MSNKNIQSKSISFFSFTFLKYLFHSLGTTTVGIHVVKKYKKYNRPTTIDEVDKLLKKNKSFFSTRR